MSVDAIEKKPLNKSHSRPGIALFQGLTQFLFFRPCWNANPGTSFQ